MLRRKIYKMNSLIISHIHYFNDINHLKQKEICIKAFLYKIAFSILQRMKKLVTKSIIHLISHSALFYFIHA